MKIADFGLARNIRDLEYYRKTTDVSFSHNECKRVLDETVKKEEQKAVAFNMNNFSNLVTNDFLEPCFTMHRVGYQLNGWQSRHCLIESTPHKVTFGRSASFSGRYSLLVRPSIALH